jgi:hypothetical protein
LLAWNLKCSIGVRKRALIAAEGATDPETLRPPDRAPNIESGEQHAAPKE